MLTQPQIEPARRRHSVLGIDLPGTEDDPLASRSRSSAMSRLIFSLVGVFTIGLGIWLLAGGWDHDLGDYYLSTALIVAGLIRFLATYLDLRGFPSAGFLLSDITGALLFAAALLDLGNSAGLDIWGILMIALPPLIMGPQHARLRPIIYAINVGVVGAAEILVNILPRHSVIPPDRLAQIRLINLVAAAVVVSVLVAVHRRMLDRAGARITEEQRISERLLANILPRSIAARLKRDENPIADGYEAATILFADMVNFTEFAASSRPERVVSLLNRLFYAFDDMVERRGLEKIKTIGDAYMAAGGLPLRRAGHAAAVAELAVEMLDFVHRSRQELGEDIDLRIGIHTGPLVAGVIGKHKFSYDVWGDTVNIAARLETASEPGSIHISEATARALGPGWRVEPRGRIALKGLGEISTYFLLGRAEAAIAAG